MKKHIHKILTLTLGAVMTLGCFAGCGEGEKEAAIPQLPDYATISPKEYLFSASSGPVNGTFKRGDDEMVLGPDQRTVEGYTTFKEAGFNVALLTGNCKFEQDDVWATSECKRAFDAATGAGIDKIVITDARLNQLIEYKDTLIGEGNAFATEADLTAQVKQYLSSYAHEEEFYGVVLRDEPDYTYTNSYGYVYKAVKAAAKELGMDYIYINVCLLPYDRSYSRFAAKGAYDNMTDAYRGYVEGYLKSTGADSLESDVYIAREEGLAANFYVTLQTFSDLCEQYGAEWSFSTQSFEMYSKSSLSYKGQGKSEMLLEMYSLMGMGCADMKYYVYQPPYSLGETTTFTEEYCFLTAAGEKTNTYYYGQEIMANAQAMADIVLNYKYQGGKFYTADVVNFDVSCYFDGGLENSTNSSLKWDNSHEFTELKKVEFDNDVVFVTELKDETNGLWMYMLQNVMNPANGGSGRTAETVTATFDSSYTYVAELKDGKLEYVKLNNGVYKKTLSAGHAVFLVPLK